jgi:hypothetical protein
MKKLVERYPTFFYVATTMAVMSAMILLLANLLL